MRPGPGGRSPPPFVDEPTSVVPWYLRPVERIAAPGGRARGVGGEFGDDAGPITGRAASFGALFVVGLVLPLAVASHYGALGVPRSDDWSYALSLFRWVDTGHLGFNHWVSMTLLGQLVISVPVVEVFGRSFWVLQVATALFGFGGLLAIVAVGRRVGPRGGGALLVGTTVAIGPLWATLTTTYMTDVPSLVSQMVALAFAARAFGPRLRPGWFVGALAVGVFSFSIRQYGIVTVLAIVVVGCGLARSGRGSLRFVVTAGVFALGACAVILFLWTRVPDPLTVEPSTPSPGTLSTTLVTMAGFARLTALLVLPVLVASGPVRIVRAAWAASRVVTSMVVAGVLSWLVITYARSPRAPFVGNYVDRVGTLSNDVGAGSRPDVMPHALFQGLVVMASIAAIVLVLAAVPGVLANVERWRRGDWEIRRPEVAVLSWTLSGITAAYAIAVLVDLPIFDRYGLVLVPLVGLLLIAAPRPSVATQPHLRRVTVTAATVAFVVLASVGLVYATDSASFDATRWSVATRATHLGYRPLQVYGGFEWLGWHRGVGPTRSENAEVRRRSRLAYFRHLCVDVAIRPNGGLQKRALVRDHVRGGLHSPTPIIAVRTDRPC